MYVCTIYVCMYVVLMEINVFSVNFYVLDACMYVCMHVCLLSAFKAYGFIFCIRLCECNYVSKYVCMYEIHSVVLSQSIIKKLNDDPKLLEKVVERVNPGPTSRVPGGHNLF